MSSTQPKEFCLSKRQHRMLQDMGIDVFFTRQQPAANHPAEAHKHSLAAQSSASPDQTAADRASPAAAARAALAMDSPVQKQTDQGSSDAAQSPETTGVEAAANRAQAPVSDDANTQAPTIELNFVTSPSLVYLSHTPLSALELRFLQDLCSGVYRVATGQPMQENLRSDEFRWPMVEASGNPARAVAVFCEKHRLLHHDTVVIGTPDALGSLRPWLEDGWEHWLEQTDLVQVASQGQEKKHLWSQVLQRIVAGH